jgi:glycosyltransferase involved in cell wall biosynthesis
LFSVVVTTYDRAAIVRRCVESCLAQSLADFELIVVDDASKDDTAATLGALGDSRIKLVVHEANRGISASRQTGVENAVGDWVVIVDSDWELLPSALERLSELVAECPAGVRVIRSRLLWDDGHITPAFVPDTPYGYEGRIRWAEAEGGHDAVHCLQRAVFATTPYFADRRGAMETLWELELAKRETTLCVADVLGKEHTDATNSWLRAARAQELVPRLLEEAPDMLWMAETTLEHHGDALRRLGPHQYVRILRVASMQAFLLGERQKGVRYGLRTLRSAPINPLMWVTLLLGLLGPRAVTRGIVMFRRLQALSA